MLNRFFKIKENNSNIKREVNAGITIFLALSYILIVNPTMLSETGMDYQGVFLATAISAGIATILMGLFTNYPFALAPGMGLNAFFTYTVVLGMGFHWTLALLAVFISGVLFLIISATSIREKLFYAIPESLQIGLTIGIGLLLIALALQSLGILVYSPNMTLGNPSAMFTSCNLIVLLGVILAFILMKKNVKGFILISIIFLYLVGVVLQLLHYPLVDVSLIPQSVIQFNVDSLANVSLFALDFSAFNLSLNQIFDFIIVIFSMLIITLFDTMGTLTALSKKLNLYTKDNKLPKLKKILSIDSLATVISGILGTSPTVMYLESTTGIVEGGKTGLTAIVCGVCFFLAIIFTPIFTIIPSYAVAPALILVGFSMFTFFKKLDINDICNFIPAIIIIVIIPLTLSISQGIIGGVIAYVVLNVVFKKSENISKHMWILFLVLAIYAVLEFLI